MPETINSVSIVPFDNQYVSDFTSLKSALRLYESTGFEYAPLPAKTEYTTANSYMELQVT